MTPSKLIARAIFDLQSATRSDLISIAIDDQIKDMIIDLHQILVLQAICESEEDGD